MACEASVRAVSCGADAVALASCCVEGCAGVKRMVSLPVVGCCFVFGLSWLGLCVE